MLTAAAIALGLMAAFIPLNIWLLEGTSHVSPGLADASNRNFVAVVVNQSLQIITIALTFVTLWMVVRLVKSSALAVVATPSKEEFKRLHPSVPEHYMDGPSMDRAIDAEQKQQQREQVERKNEEGAS